MQIDVFTLFPEMFESVMGASMLKRAVEKGAITVNLHNFRDWATDKHHIVDDTPYGGGGGMVLKPEPLVSAVESVLGADRGHVPVVLMSPQGELFTQSLAFDLASQDHVAIVCGHYEAVDERAVDLVITREISIGDYVLTGGELAAMVIIDAIARLQEGVLGDPSGPYDDSHATGLLEYPHYTRPPVFRTQSVPEVLLSGHEAKIKRWRRQQSLKRTWDRRPDMLLTANLTEEDWRYLLSLPDKDRSTDDRS